MNGKIFPSASAHYEEVSLTSKGENIFKRKDGRWEARYVKGYELSGKIKYGFCYGKTYKEAKDKAAKCKTALATGAPLPQRGSRQPFSVYCDEWLHSRRQQVKDSTYVKYDTILNRHIKPKLGGIYPFGFSNGLIESFSRELLCLEGFAPKTMKDILVVLASILKFAAKQHPGVLVVLSQSAERPETAQLPCHKHLQKERCHGHCRG